MSTWTVAPDNEGLWEVRMDGRLVDTARSHYDAREVLAMAERHAGQALSWRLDDGEGFISA